MTWKSSDCCSIREANGALILLDPEYWKSVYFVGLSIFKPPANKARRRVPYPVQNMGSCLTM